MDFSWGHQKRYNDYGKYIRKEFNGYVQKLSLNAGFTCPNRDGTLGYGGCTFCNNKAFNPSYCQSDISIVEQLKSGIKFFRKNNKLSSFLAYFQAYTNSYGELSKLKTLYEQALNYKDICGLIIGTRPDCISNELVEYFTHLKDTTYLVIELGIESTLDKTLKNVNRGHNYRIAKEMVNRLADAGILVGAHLILGLPGETKNDMLSHAREISKLPIHFLKIHQLQYIKGSILGSEYEKDPSLYKVFELDEYINLVIDFLELIRPDIVMERFASESPSGLLLAPAWGLKNSELVHKIELRMEERKTWQGRLYS